jgi:hypothetical protein
MSDKPDHKSTSYSGKKPYLTHNYRTMMKKKTQEEYYFHELHEDPMSELLRPYLNDPDLPGFTGWEYMGPSWWDWPPFIYPGGGGPGAGGVGPYDDEDGLPPGGHCTECVLVGPASVECGSAWIGQVIPSQCAGFIVFAVGLGESESFEAAGNSAGVIVVAVPDDTSETAMLVCSSGGIHGVTCCMEVAIECITCCEEIDLTGSATQGVGTTWTGVISPACPDAECEVTSNSGCTLSCGVNEAGSEVTVAVGGGHCGSFTVTVTGPGSGGSCSENSDSVTVKITGNGGDWKLLTVNGPGVVGCNVGICCGCSYNNIYAPCISGGFKYGTGQDPFTGDNACRDVWSRQCKGERNESCGPSNSAPPCDTNKSCAADAHPQCGKCDVDGGCCCMNHSYWKCEWKCAC